MMHSLKLVCICAVAFAPALLNPVHGQEGPPSLSAPDVIAGSAPYQKRVQEYLARTTPKIINGRAAEEGELPWQVSLGVSWIASPAEAHFCGGSLLSADWVITAAHCVDGNTPESVVITLGANDLAQAQVRRNVAQIFVPDGYTSADQGSDVALIKLWSPVETGALIKIISLLEDQAALIDGVSLTTSGFGATIEGGAVSSTLNVVDVPLVSNDICNAPQSYDGLITSEMLCAGETGGGTDSCQGDSGGPLVLGARTGAPELAGIVSWGEGCARPLKFGVYTKIPAMRAWIDECVSTPATCRFKKN